MKPTQQEIYAAWDELETALFPVLERQTPEMLNFLVRCDASTWFSNAVGAAALKRWPKGEK